MKPKDDEITLYFSKSWIVKTIVLNSADGTPYKLCIIEMPDDEGNEWEVKRTFTVPEYLIEEDKIYDFKRKTNLKKNKPYRILRAKYDKEARVTRVLENTTLTGQEIHDVFYRYGQRKDKELKKALTPDKHKEGEE